MGLIRTLFDLSFSTFITTRVVKFLYGLAIVVGAIFALVSYAGLVIGAQGFVGTAGAAIVGLPLVALGYLVGIALVRIGYEMIIVLFRIAENVQTVAKAGAEPRPSEPARPF